MVLPKSRVSSRLTLATLLIVVFFVVAGSLALRTPAALDADAPIPEFSAARASDHVERMTAWERPMGSVGSAAARSYLVGELEALGLMPELQATTAPDYFVPRGEMVDVVNVIGRIPGTATTGTLVFVAHYDTVPGTTGANDNAAAVGALLESARALVAGQPLTNDIVLLFTDAEEPKPRYGSNTYVSRLAEPVSLVVNLEASGSSGPSILAEVSEPEGWLVRQLRTAAPDVAAFSFVTSLTDLIGPLGTDFDPFEEAGTPGYHFAYFRGGPVYHTEHDSFEALGVESLQQHGEYLVAIGRHFGTLDLSAIPSETDAAGVFFNYGWFVFAYPPVVVAVLALLIVGLTVVWIRSSGQRFARLAGDALVAMGVAIGGSLLAALMWRAILAVRPMPGVLEAFVWASLLVVGVWWLWAAAARRHPRRDLGAGMMVVWVAMALTTSVFVPGMSYLFALPTVAALSVRIARVGRPTRGQLPGFAVATAVTTAVLVPAFDVLVQLSQPRPGNLDSEMVDVIVIVTLLGVMAFGLLGALAPRPKAGAPIAAKPERERVPAQA